MGSPRIGMSGTIAFAPTLANSQYFMPFISETLTDKWEPLPSQNIRGHRQANKIYKGQDRVEGSITFEPSPANLARAIYMFCRNRTTTASDSLQSHVMKPSNGNSYVPMDFIVSRGVIRTSFESMNCNTLNFSFAQGQLVSCEMGFVGLSSTLTTSSYTATYDDDYAYTWEQTSFGAGVQDSSAESLFGAVDLSISMNNNIDLQRTLGLDVDSGNVNFKETGPTTIEVTGTLHNNYTKIYSDYVSQSETDFTMNIKGPEVTSGYTGDFTIDIPSLRITDYQQTNDNMGILPATFTGQAIYNAGSGTSAEFTVVNSQAW